MKRLAYWIVLILVWFFGIVYMDEILRLIRAWILGPVVELFQ